MGLSVGKKEFIQIIMDFTQQQEQVFVFSSASTIGFPPPTQQVDCELYSLLATDLCDTVISTSIRLESIIKKIVK